MKRFRAMTALILTFLMVISLAACGDKSSSDTSSEGSGSAISRLDRGSSSSNKKEADTKEAETKAAETEEAETREAETKAAETKAPETRPPETKAPETKAPETKAPETKAPETKAPETKAPETKAPDARPDEKDSVVGKYKLIGIVSEDAGDDEIAVLESMGMYILLSVEPDGTAELNLAGDVEKLVWNEENFDQDNYPVPYTYKDGILHMEQDGEELTFQKISEEEYQECLKGNNGESSGGSDSKKDSDYDIRLVGAELTQNYSKEDAVRIYFEVTNNSDSTTIPTGMASMTVTQNGEKLETTYAYDDDYPEDMYTYHFVRPGVTLRCARLFAIDKEAGPIHVEFTDYYTDAVLAEMDYEIDQFPYEPASGFKIAPVTNPQWLKGAPASGDFDDCHFEILKAEKTIDYKGDPCIRVYVEFTNNSDEPTDFYMASYYRALQDGVGLDTGSSAEEVPEDENEFEEIDPDKTIVVALTFVMRSDSPVEFELYDSWDDENVVGVVYNPGDL